MIDENIVNGYNNMAEHVPLTNWHTYGLKDVTKDSKKDITVSDRNDGMFRYGPVIMDSKIGGNVNNDEENENKETIKLEKILVGKEKELYEIKKSDLPTEDGKIEKDGAEVYRTKILLFQSPNRIWNPTYETITVINDANLQYTRKWIGLEISKRSYNTIIK